MDQAEARPNVVRWPVRLVHELIQLLLLFGCARHELRSLLRRLLPADREVSRLLALLAALSHQTNVSVGCYCADESRCHRSVLRALLEEHGARLA